MVFGKPERKNAEVKDNKSPWKENQNSRAEGRFLKVELSCHLENIEMRASEPSTFTARIILSC